MIVIRIQEYSGQNGIFQAKVSFDQDLEYGITIRDPFSKEEEERLEWYFEEHLRFPFIDQMKAQKAAISAIAYGEGLFAQIFASNTQILSAYRTATKAGLHSTQIEIVGQPSFHSLHWETLKDPEISQPLALQATVVRKSKVSQALLATVHSSPTINLLIVTARPYGRRDIGYRTISRPLVESLRQDSLPVEIDILRPGTYKALEQHLRATTELHGIGYYHVIHFDVHGAIQSYPQIRHLLHNRYGRDRLQPYEDMKAFLFLEGEKNNTADPLEATELTRLLITHQVPIAILNACQSGKQVGASETSLASHLIQSGVQMVLAMGYSVTVTAATLLMKTLYQQLFNGSDLSSAIRMARCELYSRKGRQAYYNQIVDLEDWLLPVIYQNQPHRLIVRPFTSEEQNTSNERQEMLYMPPQPKHGFVGRDTDILQIEKQLLTQRNILLVRGMGGIGKTSLFHHLGGWWQITGLVRLVWYFGYDEQAWNREQLLTTIAQHLLKPDQYIDEFIHLSVDAQQSMITKQLRAERHLIILDNLESITRTQLAIPHDLSTSEQTMLCNLLADLVGGHTLILLGSRENEEWLAKETFTNHVFELSGLDPEATSALADLILKQHGVEKYRQDPDLLKLLKILAGHPLALEVVLANLVQQTPGEVLLALQLGETTLDSGNSRKKTESILYCIDYSFGNLAPETQEFLLCFAPFTSVIYRQGLNEYITQLREEATLSSLPFERWQEIVKEVIDRGLLSTYSDLPGFLCLDPIFPYFLRTRLHNSAKIEVRYAIEAAFYQYYDQVGSEVFALLHSKDPQKQEMGQKIAHLEYENFLTALEYAITTQSSVINIYLALQYFLYAIRKDDQSSELTEAILKRLKSSISTSSKSEQESEREVILITHHAAIQKSDLGQYTEAHELLQRELDAILQLEAIGKNQFSGAKAGAFSLLGIVTMHEGKWIQAEQYCQQALQILIDLDDRSQQAEIYFTLSGIALGQRKWIQAEQYYQQALQIFIDSNDNNAQADVYSQLGILAIEQKQWEKAEQYCIKALFIYIDSDNRYAQAKAYVNLGSVALGQNQWTMAKRYCLSALQIFIDFSDRSEQAKVYANLGMVESSLEQWAAAEQYYLKALDYGDFNAPAGIYLNLGNIKSSLEQWAAAEQYYLKALPLAIDINDLYQQAQIYLGLNTVARKQRQWEKVEHYLQQALQIFIELGDRVEQAQTYHLLGSITQEQKQWSQARYYYRQALSIFIDLGDRAKQADSYLYLGVLEGELAQWATAEQNYLKAIDILADLNKSDLLPLVYMQLGNIAMAQSKLVQSKQYYLQALPIYHDGKEYSQVARIYNNLGLLAQEQGHLDQAEEHYQQALAIYLNANDYQAQAQTYRYLGILAQEQNRWIEAEQFCLKALPIYLNPNDHTNLAEIYFTLGVATQNQDQWIQATEYYMLALPIYININNQSYQAKIYSNLGHLAQKQNNLTQAEEHFRRALSIYSSSDDRQKQKQTLFQLGIIAKEQRRWTQAEICYQQALDISIDIDDSYKQAEIYRELGIVTYEQQRWDEAKLYYKKALQINIGIHERVEQALDYQELGLVAIAQQQWIQAEEYGQQALRIFVDYNDQSACARIYDNLGIAALCQEHLDMAEHYFQQALQIYIDVDDNYSQAGTYLNLGSVFSKRKDWIHAEQSCLQALQIFNDFGDHYAQATTYSGLGQIALEQQQWVNAHDFLLQALKEATYHEEDDYSKILYLLARLWKASRDTHLTAAIASLIGTSSAYVEELLRTITKDMSYDIDN
jgi:tetratricopeptide (TPR) repeat protein